MPPFRLIDEFPLPAVGFVKKYPSGHRATSSSMLGKTDIVLRGRRGSGNCAEPKQ
jgi:hypothetical protein